MLLICLIDGVKDVCIIVFLFFEWEYNELNILLCVLFDGVIFIDVKGWVCLCNDVVCCDL